MSSPAFGIKEILLHERLGWDAARPNRPFGSKPVLDSENDWPIHISKMPKEIDRAITIYDTGGGPYNAKWLLDFPTVQVCVRARENEYAACFARCRCISEALLGYPSHNHLLEGGTYPNQLIEESHSSFGLSDRWVLIKHISPPTFMAYDDNNRPQVTVNFQIYIEPYLSEDKTNRMPLCGEMPAQTP